jgi:hypothetical protein
MLPMQCNKVWNFNAASTKQAVGTILNQFNPVHILTPNLPTNHFKLMH